ncbi:hypothetical protein GA0074695_5981 [Micromonospora viridifaciens]|uniref:Uncharacterized protein n=1 Tax=Micromonospora viridifaciens TaxID=1881 RepID=A0A1C4ZRA0_MICVI|nr:hypothetical protein [Micromonospora viridifaciens]SCF35439.1 hypothetical protein GA0074695_5981 [Micromonospora viridifaciens]
MNDREAIRDAFAAIADEAPSPERIQATLAARTRQHRQRRIVLRVAGMGVAAATVGVTGAEVWRLLQQPEAHFPVMGGGPGGGWLDVPLRYRPTWLPRGYGQADRSVIVVDDQAAVVALDWRPGASASDGLTPTVGLTIGWHDVLEPNRPTGRRTENVDVNGVAGQLIQTDGEPSSPYVIWQPPGQPQLIVSAMTHGDLDEQRAIALRVARSVQPDQRHISVGPRFGWLPADLAAVPWRFDLGHDGATWVQSLSTIPADGRRHLGVSIGPDVHKDNFIRDQAQPIQVRGFHGWQVPDNGQLFLTLSDGVEVYLQLLSPASGPSPNTVPELVRIVEEFDFGPWPDMAWVGTK